MNNYLERNERDLPWQSPSALQKIFIKRRSFRKYLKGEIKDNIVEMIKFTTDLFITRMGFCHLRIEIVLMGEMFRKIINAATSGVVGKINPWLKKTDATGLLVAIVNSLDAKEEKERLKRIGECSMVMQVAILRATELGFATCWLGGINSSEIEGVMELNKGEEVIAISTLGYPPKKIGFTDYDFWANRLLSRRRRPLAELYFFDTIDKR